MIPKPHVCYSSCKMKNKYLFFILAIATLLIGFSHILLNFSLLRSFDGNDIDPTSDLDEDEFPDESEFIISNEEHSGPNRKEYRTKDNFDVGNITNSNERNNSEKIKKADESTVPFKEEDPPPIHGDLTSISKYKHTDFPIAVVAFNRPEYLRKCLDSLKKVDHLNMDNVTVFQQDYDVSTANVVKEFGLKLHQHPRQNGNLEGAAHIANHYGHIFGDVFNQKDPPPFLIVVEEDMIFSPDFLDYFVQLAPLYEEDPTVWCISTWNDNGFSSRDRNPARLDRTDFFIGLGWLITRRLFKTELEQKWPQTHWDHWMRDPKQRKGRECIYPESPRNYNIGERGTHSDPGLFAKYFEKVSMNRFHHVQLDYRKVSEKNYEDLLFEELKSAKVVEDLAMLTVDSSLPLIVFVNAESGSPLWTRVLERFGLWASIPVRGMHRGLLRFRWDKELGNTVFLIGTDSQYNSVFKPPKLQPFNAESFTTLDHLKKRKKHTGPPIKVKLVAGDLDQSCTEACKSIGLPCEEDALFHINSCHYMSQFFSCSEGCKSGFGYDQPAYVVSDNTCLLQGDPNYYSCRGSHPSTRRLCPCRLKGQVTVLD